MASVKFNAAAVLLIGATAFAWGQQPAAPSDKPPAKEAAGDDALKLSLEEMLAVALQRNPELRGADIALNKALADREQLRLQTVQRVKSMRLLIERQKGAITRHARIVELLNIAEGAGRPAASIAERGQAVQILEDDKLKLGQAENELLYLLGVGTTKSGGHADATTLPAALTRVAQPLGDRPKLVDSDLSVPSFAVATGKFDRPDTTAEDVRRIDPEMVRKLSELLKTKIFMPADAQTVTLGDAVQFVHTSTPAAKGVSIRLGLGDLKGQRVELAPGEMTFAAWLETIEDELHITFLVRSYGLLGFQGDPNEMPQGAVSVRNFLKYAEGKK